MYRLLGFGLGGQPFFVVGCFGICLFMARTVLITGGCGFIGVNFVRFWRQKYPQDFIINLDKLTYAGVRASQLDLEVEDGYTFLQGDLADWEFVEHLFTGMYEVCPKPDLIVHFAAESHVDRSIDGPRAFVESNIVGTFNLLEAARLYGNVRFHHVSTDEVYGALEIKDQKEKSKNDAFSEITPYSPRSPYSASKAASDHLVRSYFHTYGLPVTISNCSNNYGPYQFPEKLLSLAITNLLQGKKVPLYGDGLHVREWLHVQDHCEAIGRILESGVFGETYMVGSGLEKSNREVLDFVIREMEFGEEMIEYVEDRKGHDRRYSVDASKIKRELGWKARIGFEEGVREMIGWYKGHEGWWRPLIEQGDSRFSMGLKVFEKVKGVEKSIVLE